MPEIDGTTAGVFNWVDLMSPDVDASKQFYGAVFDWDMEDQFDDDGERIYVMCSLRGRTVAGIGGQMPDMQGMPPMWNSYVATDDIDATSELVGPAGGSVVMAPMDIYDSGRMAVYAAPDGAVISTWQAGAHIGSELVNEHGTWVWNELMTRDVTGARAFYADVFGWSYDEWDMGAAGTYHLAAVDERQMAGIMAMPADMPDEVPNHWVVYFATDDVDATIGRCTDNGGQLVWGPESSPGVGTMASVQDPQGGSFSLMQPEVMEPESAA